MNGLIYVSVNAAASSSRCQLSRAGWERLRILHPPLLLSQFQPESHPSSFLLFSNHVFTSLVRRDLQTPSEGELLQGAEGQVGDEQQQQQK